LPDVLAKPGEPWERTEIADFGGQSFTIRKKYEYAGTEKRGDKILDRITSKVIEVKCEPDPNTQSPLKVTRSNLKVDSSEGNIRFDREAGCLVDARERVRIQGSMTFSGGGADTTGQINLTLQRNTQLQPEGK